MVAQSAITMHTDYNEIVRLVEEGASVLDLGCGEGELLQLLIDKKKVIGRGVDIDQENIIKCIEKGLTVFQADIDEGLLDYQDQSFDYVILNKTIQVTNRPDKVIKEMLRVGKKVIVGFPNFGHISLVFDILMKGQMPKNDLLPYEWYNTPNIHLLTIKDFRRFCVEEGIQIKEERFIYRSKIRRKKPLIAFFENALVKEAIFVISHS